MTRSFINKTNLNIWRYYFEQVGNIKYLGVKINEKNKMLRDTNTYKCSEPCIFHHEQNVKFQDVSKNFTLATCGQ